jgi:hypothetical protein
MSFENLTAENVFLYAVKSYDAPNAIGSELKQDLKYFIYVRRLLRRYNQTGELKERLTLNHLVILYNLFGVPAATRLLYYYTRPEDYSVLKTYLLFLGYQPDRVEGIHGLTIHSSDLPVEQTIADALRKIRTHE